MAAHKAFPGDSKKLIQVIGLTWICSGNLLASIPISLSVLTFGPRNKYTDLGKAKYSNISGYPIVIGGASWLPWQKHLYFLVLLPYYLPFWLIRLPPLQLCGELCDKKYPTWTLAGMACTAFFIFIQIRVFFRVIAWLCWGILTAVTLGFWEHASGKAGKFWEGGTKPFLMFLVILFMNKLVVMLAPLIVAAPQLLKRFLASCGIFMFVFLEVLETLFQMQSLQFSGEVLQTMPMSDAES